MALITRAAGAVVINVSIICNLPYVIIMLVYRHLLTTTKLFVQGYNLEVYDVIK